MASGQSAQVRVPILFVGRRFLVKVFRQLDAVLLRSLVCIDGPSFELFGIHVFAFHVDDI